MKLIMTLVLTLGFQNIASADTLVSKEDPSSRPYKNEVYADVNSKVDGVDFKSWESDFNESLENHDNQCTGKNCKFKNKQAFDPSWDL